MAVLYFLFVFEFKPLSTHLQLFLFAAAQVKIFK